MGTACEEHITGLQFEAVREPSTAASVELALLAEAFSLSLEAEGRSPATIAAYGYTVRDFIAYGAKAGWPDRATEITSRHVTVWLVHLQPTTRGSTPASMYRRASALTSVGHQCLL